MPQNSKKEIKDVQVQEKEFSKLSLDNEDILPKSLWIIQSHVQKPGDYDSDQNLHEWKLQLDAESAKYVSEVTWGLHPSFNPSQVKCTESPFDISRRGWGTFEVNVSITLKPEHSKRILQSVHKLTFKEEGAQVKMTEVSCC